MSRNQAMTFSLTFFAYVCYYISRKPLSVAKAELINCGVGGGGGGGGGGGHHNETVSNCSSFISENC